VDKPPWFLLAVRESGYFGFVSATFVHEPAESPEHEWRAASSCLTTEPFVYVFPL
jgi:hypothetical protein